ERVVGTIAADAHRVDAESRPQILAEPEIGGREADRAAAPVADHDAPIDLPEAAELGGGVARPTVAQQLADARRGIDRRVRPVYRLDDSQTEAMPRAHFAQQLRGAATAVAEGAVMADDDMGQPDRPEHDLL